MESLEEAPSRSRRREKSSTKSPSSTAPVSSSGLSSDEAPGSQRRRPTPDERHEFWTRTKRITFYSCIVLLAVLPLAAWKQPVGPKPQDGGSRFINALQWFYYPYEVNPWYRPPVSGFALRVITVVPGTGGKELVAGTTNGQILRTEDGGNHWMERNPPWRVTFDAISFADPKRGWATGPFLESGAFRPAILTTSNGGETWERLADPVNALWSQANFLDGSQGWAIVNGLVKHTTDGGATWNPVLTVQSARGLETTADWRSKGAPFWTAVAFSDFQHGCAASGRLIACTRDGGNQWSWAPIAGLRGGVAGIALCGPQQGWAVSAAGEILHTADGGRTWYPQTSTTGQRLMGVACSDPQNVWAVGLGGTILHTTDGGATWLPQESARYRRYPAPWFYFAMVLMIALVAWATSPERREASIVDDIVSADSPVESLQDDRLGQRPLIERLTNFLTNPNTAPPLVLSLQAPWGMGKSSVMRMLEANLKNERAAITVWFNAWHHQKEDQLLAYLLETVQRQAVPQWLSRTGISFRLDLIRVRLFDKDRRDRLALTLTAIAFLAIRFAFYDSFPDQGWGAWLTRAGYLAAGGVFLRLGTAFKSNPEKLTENAGGFLVDTFKEATRLPSLVGKSDVRQEFAENLRDVADALKPQRLVIFLDDLDRCRPDQVVQILEAINFLSSVAGVFIIVGADYTKVETLVANQFADLALKEAENARGKADRGREPLDPVQLRVEYARNYLKKIVNLRLNLKPLLPDDLKEMVREPRAVKAEPTMFARYGRVVATLAAPLVLVAMLWAYKAEIEKPQNAGAAPQVAAAAAAPAGNAAAPFGQVKDGGANGSQAARPADLPTSPAPAPVPQQDGRTWRLGLLIGIPSLLALLGLIARLARPANIEQAKDDPRFKTALVDHATGIFEICRSPREVRRLLNYLRLVAARTAQLKTDKGQELRKLYSRFDDLLVGLAVRDPAAQNAPSDIRQYYQEQCAIFGLDPHTFQPMENGGGDHVPPPSGGISPPPDVSPRPGGSAPAEEPSLSPVSA